jgi:hypothetical protein
MEKQILEILSRMEIKINMMEAKIDTMERDINDFKEGQERLGEKLESTHGKVKVI